MTKTRALLPLAFLFVTAACGGVTGLPSAPRVKPDSPVKAAPSVGANIATKAAVSKVKPVVQTTTKARASTAWYERYDLGNVVLEMDDRAKEGMNGANRSSYRPAYENPGLKAYERRLVVLRKEQQQLLRENARLRKQLRSAETAVQAQELREMQQLLAQLSAGQAEVTAQAHAVVAEHGALLAQLKRALPEQLAQLEQP